MKIRMKNEKKMKKSHHNEKKKEKKIRKYFGLSEINNTKRKLCKLECLKSMI